MSEIVFSITCFTVKVYRIKSDRGSYWADITVDEGKPYSRILVNSDYGHWNYSWASYGDSFKRFLMKLSLDYVANKFDANKWFDSARSARHYRNMAAEFDWSTVKDFSRSELERELDELDNLTYTSDFIYHVMRGQLAHLQDSPDLCYDIHPQFKKFWEQMWPVFIQKLKEEDEAENPPAEPV